MPYVYLEIDVLIDPSEPWREIMVAYMGDLDFESFLYTDMGFRAYIPETNFLKDEFEKLSLFSQKDISISYSLKKILPENWNEKWEKDFSPVKIGNECIVRADFHQPEKVKYDLIITPKMSFGTGHHQTTQMMITFLLKMNCTNKKFLDMGTGTGILSILSEKKGARAVHAVDFDPWCVENTLNNISVNNCNIINVELSSDVPSKGTYDVILANINRNVLIDQIPFYARRLCNGGVLLMSGFYIDDLLKIQTFSNEHGFKFIRNFIIDDWVATEFIKS